VRATERRCPFCAAELGEARPDRAGLPPPRARTRAAFVQPGSIAMAGAVAGTLALALGTGGTACYTTLSQPFDGGKFPEWEGGHPVATMYGAPCDLDVNPTEHCCGLIAKPIPTRDCLDCTGAQAFAICVNGGFNCTCACEVPAGYSVLAPGAAQDCGPPPIEAGPGDGPEETSASETGTDAPADGPVDATSDASPGDAPGDGPKDGPAGDAG
jgi:hypothetical protein